MPDTETHRPILIAGFGSVGRRHFQNLKHLGCRQFVFLRSGRGTIDDKDTSGFPSTSRLDEALDYRPKAVIIATPSAMHLDIALQAAEAGCDLYIEKPLGHTLTGVNRLIEIVHQHRLIAMVGCQFRFHPLLLQLHAMIAGGQLGRITGAAAEWGEYLPAWHPWEDHRESYSARLELGGGVLLTLIHPLDYLYWLFGEWRRLQAMVARVPSLDTPAGEDWSDVNIEFTSGVLGHVHLDYIQRPPVHRLSVVGDMGRVLWDYHSGELRCWALEGESVVHRVPEGFERNHMFLNAMEHFLACVRDRTEPRVPIGDGAAVLKMALDARRSATSEASHA